MSKHNHTLTAERVRFMFNYDAQTGSLTWKNTASAHVRVGDEAGGVPNANGRIYLKIDGAQVLKHRVVWLHHYGRLPRENISAINGDYTDLRIENLTAKTTAEVAATASRRSNTSGYRGVSWDKAKKKWQATITRDYKQVMLGRFDTPEEAYQAYLDEVRRRDRKPIISDVEGRRERSTRTAHRVQLRKLWRDTIKENGGAIGWDSYDHFVATLQPLLRPRHKIVAADPARKISSENFRWVPTRFDAPKKTSGEIRAYNRKHRAEKRHLYKDWELRRTFGITLERYQQMMVAQNGVCAICKQPETEIRRGQLQHLSVDHCHKTNEVRALLCGFCNRGIGSLRDDPALIDAAAAYVREHAARIEARSASSSNMKTPKER